MAVHTIKLDTNDDGEAYEDDFWHLVFDMGGGHTVFCSGEFFGYGEGKADGTMEDIRDFPITCPTCIELIKRIQTIKLPKAK